MNDFLSTHKSEYITYILNYTSILWTSMTTDTGKVLHFRNCTSNCSNNSRVLELSQTLSSNPCSQKNELKFFIMVLVNPTYHPSFAQMEKTAHVRQDPQVTGTA
jgi:hypothetical protein